MFGLLVRGAGLVIALPLFVIMTAFASVKFRWVPTLVLAAVTTVFCALVFVKGLGVPLPHHRPLVQRLARANDDAFQEASSSWNS